VSHTESVCKKVQGERRRWWWRRRRRKRRKECVHRFRLFKAKATKECVRERE
jgi:hypothetical protein